MAKYLKQEYYECQCSTPEHLIVFKLIDKDDDTICATIHLSKLPFYKRVVNGIKYIFGYSCQYGHFDEFLIDTDTAKRMIKMLNYFQKNRKENDRFTPKN